MGRRAGPAHAMLPWRGEKAMRAIQEKAREARYALLSPTPKLSARRLWRPPITPTTNGRRCSFVWRGAAARRTRRHGARSGFSRRQGFSRRETHSSAHRPAQTSADRLCLAQGQTFFDDPSNAHPAYARTRLRALAEPLHDLGFNREKARKLAERAQKADAAIDWAASEIFRRTSLPEKNLYDLASVEKAPLALVERFLSFALTSAAGGAPQRLDRLETLAENISKALNEGHNFPRRSAVASSCSTGTRSWP